MALMAGRSAPDGDAQAECSTWDGWWVVCETMQNRNIAKWCS